MLQAFSHFPVHHDPKDYTNATPPAPSNCSHLTAFSYACWDRQFGNSIPNSTPWREISASRTKIPQLKLSQNISTNKCATDLQSIHH
ncbi:hypothetical protein ACHAW6_014453 [Cyclotella cf. meneghiniana]